MSRLSNTPRQNSVLRLEARKSFAFGMRFRNARRHPIDMSTAEVRMVIGRPKYQGGGQLLTKDATVVDAALGLVQFELQASDLDLDEGEYSFTVVIEGQHGYSTVVLKGVIDLVDNDELESTSRTFSGINPSTNIAVSVEEGNLVDVQVDSVDGLTVIVEDRISDFTGQMDAKVAVATDEADSSLLSATSAAASSTAAAASAELAATVALGDANAALASAIANPASMPGAALRSTMADELVDDSTEVGAALSATFETTEYAKLDRLVNAYIPRDVDRLSLVTNWAPGHGWNIGATGSVITTDTFWGATALRITPAATATNYQASWSGTAIDTTGKRFVMWARVPDVGTLAYLRLQVHSSATDWARFEHPANGNNYPPAGGSVDGWVPFEFSPSAATTSSGTVDWAAINEMRVTLYRAGGSVAHVDVGAIALRSGSAKYPNGVVTWSFDDWHITDYTVGKAKLDTMGWVGSAFICPARIEAEGAASVAMAHEMQDAGWDMAAHSYDLVSHVPWTTWTEAQLMAEWERMKRKMIALGLTSGIDHLATPTGAHSAVMVRLAKAGWWSTIRVTGQLDKPRKPVPVDPYRHGCLSFTTLDTAGLNAIKASLDDARANGGHYIVNAHDLGDATTRANWLAAVDYAASIGLASAPYVEVVTGR